MTYYNTLIKLEAVQKEHKLWQATNFGEQSSFRLVVGIFEELGEASHAVLKSWQGIRGTPEEHYENFKDALADTMIYVMGFTSALGYELKNLCPYTHHTHPPVKLTECMAVKDGLRNAYKAAAALLSNYDYRGLISETDCYQEGLDTFIKTLIDKLNGLALLTTGETVYDLMIQTWEAIVKQRDWVANPNNQ